MTGTVRVLRLLVGLFQQGLVLRVELLAGDSLRLDGRGLGRLLGRAAPRGHHHGAHEHQNADNGTEKDQQQFAVHDASLNG